MPRPPRNAHPGELFHVTARGVLQQPIFFDDGDRLRFLAHLREALTRFDVHCLQFCLLDNHYHLLLQPAGGGLSQAMQHLNSAYAVHVNRRRERAGHLFQSRFWSRRVSRDAYLLSLIRYIAHNPVRAGLARTVDDWRWSSHAAITGAEPRGLVDVRRLYRLLGEDEDQALRVYTGLVRHPVGELFATAVEVQTRTGGADLDTTIARLHHTHGYHVRAVARALDLSEQTVRRRLRNWSRRSKGSDPDDQPKRSK